MITKTILRSEALAAKLAPVLLRRGLPYPVNHTLVCDQVRFLRISIPAVLADEGLGVQVARLVILEIVIRHKPLAALLATISKIAPMHSSDVSSQRNFIRRGETARFAGVRDAAVDLHVTHHFRRTFEGSLANGTLVRTYIAVLHHVTFELSLPSKMRSTRGTFVCRPFLFSPDCFFPRINRGVSDVVLAT